MFRLVALCRALIVLMDAGCPTLFDAQLLRTPLEYLHEPYTAWKSTSWATFLLW